MTMATSGSSIIKERIVDGVVILSLERGLKGLGEAALKERLDELVRAGHTQILIDLGGLPNEPSTELGRLIRCHLSVRQAGGRVRPLVERGLAQHRPKQYCAFVGTRSMLQHTLDRADRLAQPECKVTVVARGHRQAGWATPGGVASGIVVAQPANCDTAAGIFLPL